MVIHAPAKHEGELHMDNECDDGGSPLPSLSTTAAISLNDRQKSLAQRGIRGRTKHDNDHRTQQSASDLGSRPADTELVSCRRSRRVHVAVPFKDSIEVEKGKESRDAIKTFLQWGCLSRFITETKQQPLALCVVPIL